MEALGVSQLALPDEVKQQWTDFQQFTSGLDLPRSSDSIHYRITAE